MKSHELLEKIETGESSLLELKRIVWRGVGKINDPHPDSLADELAAFANAAGGMLVLGIDDKTRDILGIDKANMPEVEQWVRNIAHDKIETSLYYVSEHLQVPDHNGVLQYVIVLNIPRSLWIHQSPGGYLYRVGDEKRLMPPDVLARMFQQRSQARLIRFEEQAVPGTSIADVVITKHLVKPEDKADASTQLQRLHLTAIEDNEVCLSVAGVLLCTQEPGQWIRGAYIQAVAHRGLRNDPADQIDAKDFTGPITEQIEFAFNFVMRHMLVPATKDLGRRDYPQYDRRAIFEAIVNAVAHRDYSIHGAKIRLHMFADRIEICVPGPLTNTMSIDAMTSMSMPRNDVLCSLLSRIPVPAQDLGRQYLMDKRGAGVDVILTESERISGKVPVYRQIGNLELQLTIFAAPSPHDGSPSPSNLPSL